MEKYILEIIRLYKLASEFEDNEALDGDEVDLLVKRIKNQINLIEGNITPEEFSKLSALRYYRPRKEDRKK